jgi:hypothetical protein
MDSAATMDGFTQHLNAIAHWPWEIVLDNLGAGSRHPLTATPAPNFDLR